jgi:hypothetical protein
VVERWCSNGIDTTRPPRASVSRPPAIFSTGQSPPLTSTSGLSASISAAGVASSNEVTASTDARAATSAMRSASAFTGRSGPLPRRRAEASLFSATTSAAPSARACSR